MSSCVVHLAALAHPTAGTPYDVYTTNVVSTFNVLAQAGALGIDRAVVASSINAFGVPFNPHDVRPAYFPLDEKIPADVADWYSLSKQNDENTARMAWRRWGIDVVVVPVPARATRPRYCSRQADGCARTRAAGCGRLELPGHRATRRTRSSWG